MKKFLKWVGIIFVILIIISVISNAGKSNNTQTSVSNTETQKPTVAQEPMKITAQQLADDFDSNQVAADNKWNGKLVEFSAAISNITDSGISFTDVASKQFSMTQISCDISDKQQLLSIKNGETVTVRGTVGKQTIGVIDVSDCQIVK